MNKNEIQMPPPEPQEIKDWSPIQVEVGSNFEDAIRRFKSQVQREGVLSLYKEKQRYEKPSERKRRKKREIQERRRLIILKEKQMKTSGLEYNQDYSQNKYYDGEKYEY